MWRPQYVIKKLPVPIKLGTVILIEVILCNLLSSMLLVYIGSYPKYILRYQFLILNAYHPYILYLLQWGCEDPWLFFEAKMGPASKIV
jgi:hypothetical protein